MSGATDPNNPAKHLTYYPDWLDRLADGVVLQASVMNGEVRGKDKVARILSVARSIYAFQDFRSFGYREELWNEDYRARIVDSEKYHPGGVEIWNFVVIYFDDNGESNRIVMNHRPLSAAVLFSQKLREKFGDEFGPAMFFGGETSDVLSFLDEDLSHGPWPKTNPGGDHSERT